MSTKINAVVDEAGLPIRLSISPGQASDKAAAPALIDSLNRTSHVVDRGYDAMALIERIEARGAEAHIPTQRDRKVQRSVDHAIYRQRNLVERYFNKLKHFRRIATRFEKLAVTFLSAIALASTSVETVQLSGVQSLTGRGKLPFFTQGGGKHALAHHGRSGRSDR